MSGVCDELLITQVRDVQFFAMRQRMPLGQRRQQPVAADGLQE
jgi:hypothetical protein